MAWVLLNNDFETPNVGSGNATDFSALSGTNWTSSTGFAGITQGNVGTINDTGAFSGIQSAFFYDNGWISQSVGSIPAGTYTLSLYARKSGYGAQNNITLQVDATLVHTFTVPSGTWSQFTSVPFTVAAGTRVIRFDGTSPSGGNIVQFDLVTIAQVPSLFFRAPSLSLGGAGNMAQPGVNS